MEKLPMCRICLVQNVRMFVVVNKNLRELYEKLTDIPFVTEDSRPILACFICCAKLKQCYRLLRQCLEAEEMFAQKINEDYETNLLTNQDLKKVFSWFIKSPIVHISIDNEHRTESIAIKDESSDVCEGRDDIIEPNVEHQSDELELENADNSCLDVADIPPAHSESDLEDDVPLMEFKTKVVEDQEVSKKERRTRATKRATVAKTPKRDTRRTKLEDAMTAEETKKENSDSKVIRTTQKRTSKPGPYLKEPYKCDQRRYNRVKKNIQHTRTQIGETVYKCDVCQRSLSTKYDLTKHIRIHIGEKPYKCDVCQRSYSKKHILTRHIRIHTGGETYKCDLCQRSFKYKCTLKTHSRQHTGERPFKCDICQCSFRENGHLKNHIRIHTGEKPYKCDICKCSFRQSSHLKYHSCYRK